MSYLFGALPIGLLVGRMVKGIDVRDYGSGNIGASNVWRTMGPFWGVAVFLFDFCKGYFPTLLAGRVHGAGPWLPVLVGLAALPGRARDSRCMSTARQSKICPSQALMSS